MKTSPAPCSKVEGDGFPCTSLAPSGRRWWAELRTQRSEGLQTLVPILRDEAKIWRILKLCRSQPGPRSAARGAALKGRAPPGFACTVGEWEEGAYLTLIISLLTQREYFLRHFFDLFLRIFFSQFCHCKKGGFATIFLSKTQLT